MKNIPLTYQEKQAIEKIVYDTLENHYPTIEDSKLSLGISIAIATTEKVIKERNAETFKTIMIKEEMPSKDYSSLIYRLRNAGKLITCSGHGEKWVMLKFKDAKDEFTWLTYFSFLGILEGVEDDQANN